MALASAKQLLDELMGRDRDLNVTEKKHDYTWDGPDICKHFLAKFCPHDLFVNTKADLGACSKIHDERLKKEYEKSNRFQKMGYEEDFLRFCQSMLSDVDKRIRRARQRLALSNQHNEQMQPAQPPKNDCDEKINVLSDKINNLLVQVENLGCEGKVEEAQGIMKLCDLLKEERETLRKQAEQTHWYQTAEIAAAQEKQMEVCDVCGAFLIVGDAQQRVDDHLQGKQHVGYARLKEAVDEIVNSREKERTDREKQREREREERRRLKEEEDRRREDRRKALEEERRRENEKQRERDRARRRSRSRENRRSRSRERHRRSRSRDRSRRDRERRRHRSHSKERRHRSRSRSRDSSHRSHKSRSTSPDGRKDHKREKDRGKEYRRHSNENGASVDRRGSDDRISSSKGHSTAGDSDH